MIKFNKKRRDILDIYHDILYACKTADEGKINKTRLMFKANLTYDVAKKYISKLEEKGFIAKDDDNLYYITEKGEKALQLLSLLKVKKDELRRLVESIREEGLLDD
ncbi:winged helix-turn-helix domain-containing protein [Sulfolobaceae archaeon RB850M]|jgi:predicted transcriptional regulator